MSETSASEERDSKFARTTLTISTLWTIFVVGAGIMLVLFRDVFV